jgi:hypothetical protein
MALLRSGRRSFALTVFDDGCEAALYVGGEFTSAFDSGDSYLAKWGCPPPERIGSAYCGPAVPNSSGGSANISAFGSAEVAANDLCLTAAGLPADRFGYFLASQSSAFVMNPGGSQGNLCLGSPFGRFASLVQSSGPQGTLSIDVDLANIPLLGPVLAGDTFNFQCWFRDVNPMSTSNFSDAVAIVFQ